MLLTTYNTIVFVPRYNQNFAVLDLDNPTSTGFTKLLYYTAGGSNRFDQAVIWRDKIYLAPTISNFIGVLDIEDVVRTCASCVSGTYSDDVAAYECTACASSNSVSPAGSTSSNVCACDTGFTGPNGGTCTQCDAGEFKDVTGSGAYEACPANNVSPAGSTSSTECACDVGYTGLNGGTCTQCEASEFKDVTGSGECEACPASSDSPVGSTSSSNCA